MKNNSEQGIGFAEYTGYFPLPNLKHVFQLIDDDNYPHVIVLDYSDGRFYDISTRSAPSDTYLEPVYLDKVGIDGTGGYNITPDVWFKEDRGESERFALRHYSSKFFVRPNVENVVSGTYYKEYLSSTEFSAYIYKNGEIVYDEDSNTVNPVRSEDIGEKNEVVYDRSIEGFRLQSRFYASKSGFSLVGRNQQYIVKDLDYDMDNRITTEGNYQEEIGSDLLLWFSRGERIYYDRVSGGRITGDSMSLATGPDGRTETSIYFDDIVNLGSISSTSSNKSVFTCLRNQSVNTVTIGGTEVSLTKYSSMSGTFDCYYASGISSSGSVLITPSGSNNGYMFDFRIYNDDKSSNISYYFKDILENNGDNICPLG